VNISLAVYGKPPVKTAHEKTKNRFAEQKNSYDPQYGFCNMLIARNIHQDVPHYAPIISRLKKRESQINDDIAECVLCVGQPDHDHRLKPARRETPQQSAYNADRLHPG
jgi:hypothetical protein